MALLVDIFLPHFALQRSVLFMEGTMISNVHPQSAAKAPAAWLASTKAILRHYMYFNEILLIIKE